VHANGRLWGSGSHVQAGGGIGFDLEQVAESGAELAVDDESTRSRGRCSGGEADCSLNVSGNPDDTAIRLPAIIGLGFSEAVCRRQALISWVTSRTKRRDRMEMKAISMKATRCPSVRSKTVCVLQTYMGKEFNVNEQTV
jgi:hypothetical protein